jgi:multicomponent Na+:H+ antiporter subunit F
VTAVFNVAVALVCMAGMFAAWRAVRGRNLADRAVAFEAITPALTCGMLLAAVITGEDRFIDLALVLGLLAFLTTVTVARYMEGRRR